MFINPKLSQLTNMEEEFEEETYLSEGSEEEEDLYEDDEGLSPEEEGFLKGYNEAMDSEEY